MNLGALLGVQSKTLHQLRWQMYQSLLIYSRSLNNFSQDQLGGAAEETGGAGAGWAAAQTPGGLPDAEAEGGRAEGRRLWEDLRAGRGERRGGLQGLPQALRADHGEEGNLVGTSITKLFYFNFFLSDRMHILILPYGRCFVQPPSVTSTQTIIIHTWKIRSFILNICPFELCLLL